MFSIAAINDTDSRGQWEPLAPTKEAREFHLSQKYHDGLLKLQCKDYPKAQELLEAVLQDPLVLGAQVDCHASDGHLLQLRFLALKNLATVFLEQGSLYYENALGCYLQAVEIDTKDSVVWNRLGTLSCSMGLLSTSRWAFEQGLLCSPNNWNCMEKLLEVLIAIGDEAACLSIADLILRNWPSHSRAMHVKQTIEDGELTPFAPCGVDKLVPKHMRLKFPNKRKAVDKMEVNKPTKRANQNIEICLSAATWDALADEVIGILSLADGEEDRPLIENLANSAQKLIKVDPNSASDSKTTNADVVKSKADKYGEIRQIADSKIAVKLPSSSEIISSSGGDSEAAASKKHYAGGIVKLSSVDDEHHQERRSTRLERLRNRKPGKEEPDNSSSMHLAKTVFRVLEPFVIGCKRSKDSILGDISRCPEIPVYSPSQERNDIVKFISLVSKNHGACHLGHLLLEEIARTEISHRESFTKFMDLEKLTRQWPQDRTPICSLFLAELYYDSGLDAADDSKQSELFAEASFQLCKVIEWAAQYSTCGRACTMGFSDSKDSTHFEGDHLFHLEKNIVNEDEKNTFPSTEPEESKFQTFGDPIHTSGNNFAFWIRFSWLSASLSVISGNNAEAIENFSLCFSILKNQSKENDSSWGICLPHCKLISWLSPHKVEQQINLLRIQSLLKSANGLLEKKMYRECTDLLAPFLQSSNFTDNIYTDILVSASVKDRHPSNELLALDILLSACERAVPLDIEVYLNSHRRKLQLLAVASGINDLPEESCNMKPLQKSVSTDTENYEQMQWKCRVAQEVKEISNSVCLVKTFLEKDGSCKRLDTITSIIGDIQFILLRIMYNFGKVLGLKTSMSSVPNQADQVESQAFVDSAVAFCKLQHLDPTISIKIQVDLLDAIHDLLSEFGLCCAGKDNEGKEGVFLKLAINHLLSLDVKLKSSFHLSSEKLTMKQTDGQTVCVNEEKMCFDHSISSSSLRVAGEGKVEEDSLLTSVNEESAPVLLPVLEAQGRNERGLELVKGGTYLIPSQEKCPSKDIHDWSNLLGDAEREDLELGIDCALDQSFFCLYGLDLRSSQDSSCEDDLAIHKNTSRGDYQTKEQCADVFQYILPYAKVSSKAGIVKLRRVLRAIRKHFPRPHDDVIDNNFIDKFLDSPSLCEDRLFEIAGDSGNHDEVMSMLYGAGNNGMVKGLAETTSGTYLDVFSNLYYYITLAEEISATDKVPGFVLNKEGEEFVAKNANLLIYDLLYNPMRFESWQKLANIYDEEVDLLLNDGSKHITIADWQKNSALIERVERGRRRSRRCLLMSLALARTPVEQCQIHELLGLVYYDSLQNVVPFYDQRTVVPRKDLEWSSFCMNSFKNFEKAFAIKPDWIHAFYLGKLCEKMSYPPEKAFAYYKNAIKLNPTAVDPFYRMHASRLKLLNACGMQNIDAVRLISLYAYNLSTKKAIFDIFGWTEQNPPDQLADVENNGNDNCSQKKMPAKDQFQKAWHLLFEDCISAIGICTDGELKHYHKARYAISQGFLKRNENEDLERAKDELSFCFKSSRSSFTINMWEIDSTAKKAKRKTPSHGGNKRNLEVHLPESSRKFITCIRKYILLYLELLENLKDASMLEKAYAYLRTDRRFSLCIGDIIPLTLGRNIKVLSTSILDAGTFGLSDCSSSLEQLLEKMFHILMDHMNIWGDISTFPEIKCPEVSEAAFYGFIHQFIHSLESNARLDALEGINEKIRKRFKNPKLASPECAKICKHASLAWCCSILVKLASITPVADSVITGCSSGAMETGLLLFVDLQQSELYSSIESELNKHELERKCCSKFSKIKNLRIRQALDNDMEAATSLLKCAYSFYRDTSCGAFPAGINLYTMVSSQPAQEARHSQKLGIDVLDLSVPRKLLLWAYTLVHGYYSNISAVVKYCEENTKLKTRRGVAAVLSCSTAACAPQTGLVKEKIIHDKRATVDETSSTSVGLSQTVNSESLTHGSELQQCNVKMEVNTTEDGDNHGCN